MQLHLDLHNRVRVHYGWQGLSAGRGCFERRVIPKGYCHSSRPSRAPHRYSCSPAARPRRPSPGLDRRHPRHGRQLLRPQRVLQGIRDPVNRGAIGQVASAPINAEPPDHPASERPPPRLAGQPQRRHATCARTQPCSSSNSVCRSSSVVGLRGKSAQERRQPGIEVPRFVNAQRGGTGE